MKAEIDVDFIAGVLSVLILIIQIIGVVIMISQGHFFGLFDIVLIIAFAYTAHKTLIKKEELTRWEWVAFIVLAAIAIFAFLLGAFQGLIYGYPTGSQPTYQLNYTEIEPPEVSNISNITTYEPKPLDMQLIENKTITVEGNSYYVQPINLEANQTAQFLINVTGQGVVNTLMLNSTEYQKLTGGGSKYFHYYINSYTSGIRSSNFYVTVPKDGTYYLILSTFPILEGQATYESPVRIILSIYTSK